MTRPLLHLLSDEERAVLHEQTLTVLEEVGVAFNTPMAMDVLEGTEAILDRERLTARLPREARHALPGDGAEQSCCSRRANRPTTCGWVTAA